MFLTLTPHFRLSPVSNFAHMVYYKNKIRMYIPLIQFLFCEFFRELCRLKKMEYRGKIPSGSVIKFGIREGGRPDAPQTTSAVSEVG